MEILVVVSVNAAIIAALRLVIQMGEPFGIGIWGRGE